jgi:hypothetical protein
VLHIPSTHRWALLRTGLRIAATQRQSLKYKDDDDYDYDDYGDGGDNGDGDDDDDDDDDDDNSVCCSY